MTVGALAIALSGLKVTQRGIDLTARNVANVQTPGYTRKILPQETVIAEATPIGVIGLPEVRVVDRDLQRDYWRAVSDASAFSIQDRYLGRLQSVTGPPESETALPFRIGELEETFSNLAATPESDVLQREVVERARRLAADFNRSSEEITRQRNDVQDAIATSVTEINDRLTVIAELNTRLIEERANGRSTADLADKRDEAIKAVAEELEISYFERPDGAVVVQTRTGRELAATQAQQLAFNPTPLSVTSAYPGSAAAVRLGDPVTGVDLTTTGLGGQLGSLITLRDTTLPRYQAQTDELAHKLALRLEAQDLRLFVNAAGIVPADAPPAYVGFSTEMVVNPAVLANPALTRDGTGGGTPDPADNTLILNVLDFAFGPAQDAAGTPHVAFRTTGLGPDGSVATLVPPQSSVEQYARGILAAQAGDHAEAVRRTDTELAFRDTLERRLLDESGVDLDAEVANLTQLQQAYASAAQIIQTVDRLFQELLNAVGR